MTRRVSSVVAGFLCVLASGLAWAAFVSRLHVDGHAPSRVLIPVARDAYYRWQAWVVTPTLLILWAVFVAVSHRLARAMGGHARWQAVAGPLGVCFGLPMLVLFVLPEWVLYARHGFDALKLAIRFTAPVTALVVVGSATRVLHTHHRLAWPRALLCALLAWLAQAILGSPVLR